MNAARKGFTIIEALASAVLLGVGITAAMSALGAIAKGEGRARETEKVQRMALDKYEELISITPAPITSQSGDFTDRNIDGYTWNMDIESSAVTNLSTVTVTVQKSGALPQDPKGSVEGLLYQPATTTTTTTTTGAAGGAAGGARAGGTGGRGG